MTSGLSKHLGRFYQGHSLQPIGCRCLPLQGAAVLIFATNKDLLNILGRMMLAQGNGPNAWSQDNWSPLCFNIHFTKQISPVLYSFLASDVINTFWSQVARLHSRLRAGQCPSSANQTTSTKNHHPNRPSARWWFHVLKKDIGFKESYIMFTLFNWERYHLRM